VPGLLALLVLLLSFASVSPIVHEKLHCGEAHSDCSSSTSNSEDDQSDGAHFCAVNWLAGGVLLVESVLTTTSGAANRLEILVESEQRAGLRNYLFSRARAPPLKLI